MIDVTDATFEAEILERSDQVPVVVDLWAPWCGPCRTLGPIIEKVVGETDGEVVLAKVNTDENPGLSQAFQVQGIPAVHAVYQRKVVASFIGAQPEAKVRQFVESLLPSESERAVAALLEAGDEASLLKVLDEVPGHPGAVIALAELYVHEGRPDDALAMLHKIPESPETRRVAALARTGAPVEDADQGPLAGVDVEAKLQELLTRVKGDDDARQEYLDLLELMGPTDPRTVEYRRALSRQLF
ncbi:MAG TPA: tetratricopeptide repeat protein [Aquihabitans sp.]|jgi:putative thioredoxin|nr:tetratricopeptide repeat protein [Aquihabitans sp.]